MSLYRELRPDPASLPIEIARTSLEQSRRALTRPFGQAIVTNGAGGTSILGAGGGDGLIPWVDDSEPPSRPTGLSAASTSQVITVHWDGTLEYGLPADFHSIEIHIQPDGGDDTVIGTLRVAGDVASGLLTEGDIVDVWAVALDDAHDRVGEWTPNRSEASDVITLVVEPVVSQGQLRDKADEILAAADDSVKAQIERVDTDLAATNEAIDRKADEILEAAKADATAKADAVDQKVQATNSKVQANADAIKAESDRVSGLGTKVDGQGTKLGEVEDSLAEAKQAALGAQVTADGKNAIYRQTTDPALDPVTAGKLVAGDLWWQTSEANLETYWLGEPNNSVSVLVDHSDEIEAMWIWNGSRWNRHVLYAQDLLVNGSIVAELLAVDCVEARHIKVGAIEADKLAATALYGHVIKGGTFLTSNERLVIDNEGLLLKDSGGNATITMLASNGSATFRDVNIIDGTLTTPWLVSSNIAGGTVSGATVTGGTVQTVTDANRGIKMTGGNLDIYRADAKRFLRVNEAGIAVTDGDKSVLTYAKVGDTWTLSLDGAIQSGGEISGAAITGAAIRTNTEWQSSEAAKKYRGVVITDGGMFAYKGNGKEEYSMAFTAATGELKLDGAISTNAVFNAPTISAGQMVGTNIYTGTDADNRVSITSAGLTVTHDGNTVISFAADGAVDLGSSGIAADSRVSDLTDEVHDSYTPINMFEQTTGALTDSVTDVQTQVEATADRLDEEIDTRKQYMQFDPNNGLTIGDLTNTDAYSVQLTSTAMQFRAGNTVAAYVSNDRLYINNAEVVNTLRIGNFAFLPRDNGHMSLQYVGGSATVQEV